MMTIPDDVRAAMGYVARNEIADADDCTSWCVVCDYVKDASDHIATLESRLAEADALRKDAAIGRAYMRWYAAAKGYKNVAVEAAHKAIIDHAHLNPTTDTTEPT